MINLKTHKTRTHIFLIEIVHRNWLGYGSFSQHYTFTILKSYLINAGTIEYIYFI